MFQVDEVESKKEQKLVVRERFKVPEVRRAPRSELVKDKKDRTLDPMDPASYSDIPRYVQALQLSGSSLSLPMLE